MTRKNVAIVALILGALGVVFFVSVGFDILPSNVARFLGIASLIFAGILWAVRSQLEA